VSFLIAIVRLQRGYYGPTHKIPDSPDEGRALAVRFSELGPRRHDFVHGAAWQTHENSFEATGIRVKNGNYAVENHRFDQSDAIGLTNEIAKLQDDMATFMLKVANILKVASPINH
jgi:hypothetical protein